ncbi:uncharacterized protein LOC142550640 [Primulina tabacum]|uniref:uncharacterized protein LOC142550640 n=1 Tax=Primulina tabacum TaxID=48773 RepID=UPI003F5A7F5A
MAEGTRFSRLEETLSKLITLQESQAAMIEKQHTSIDTFNTSLSELTVGLKTLDAKVEQQLRRNNPAVGPSSPPQPQLVNNSNRFQSSELPSGANKMQIDFPRFSGDHPSAWVARIQSCTEFLSAIIKRFGPLEYEDHFGKLSKLTQSGSLAEYQHQFEQLTNNILDIPEHVLISCFVFGLRPEIRKETQVYRPRSLIQAMSLAKLYEDKFSDSASLPVNWGDNSVTSKQSFAMVTPSRPPLLPTPPGPKKSYHMKRLTPAKMLARREKGLCYNCDEKFFQGHKCKGQFFLCIVPEVEVAEKASGDESSLVSPEMGSLQDCPEISLHALVGQPCPRALRLTAFIKKVQVQTLIDGGSTHNFIQERLARFLKLPIILSPHFSVMIGNGQSMTCQGHCPKVTIELDTVSFVIDLYVIQVQGAEIVLGVQWLQGLGKFAMDYSQLYMEFMYNGRLVQLRGQPLVQVEELNSHQMRRLSRTEGIAGCFQLFALTGYLPNNDKVHPNSGSLAALLDLYQDVFMEQQSLPPHRSINHSIHFLPNTKPINPKSIFVLCFACQKNDDTWRFCVDYRALNHVTIKDKFPIPTIDELLDEFYGATIFSKLDLRAGYHQIPVNPHDIPKTAFRSSTDPTKIEAIWSWPVPKNLRALKGFLGLSGFYRKFVKGYASIAHALMELLKKDSFCWSPTAQTSFENLKQSLSHTPVLALPDFSLPFQIRTDASGVGIGAVLLQQGHPLAYFRKKLPSHLLKASTYVRELLAITQAVSKWRQYLLGHHFSIVTDHRSLKEILSQTIHTPDQQKYLVKLLGYDFDISYQPGSSNTVADALSRQFELPDSGCGISSQLLAILILSFQFLTQLKDEVASNPFYKNLIHKNSAALRPIFHLKDGLVYRHHRICVDPDSEIIPKILFEFHNTPVARHGGMHKTLARIVPSFFWENMKRDIQVYVANCAICQQTKYSTQKLQGLLQPLSVPAGVWEDISMDFITGLPASKGFSVIFVVVDRLSKFAHFGPLKSGFTATMVATLFVDMVVKLHSILKSIVSDRDPFFLCKFWGRVV